MLTNLDFETDDVDPGDALAWSITETITVERRAVFGTTVLTDGEAFETEWDSNEDYLFAFEGVGTDLTPALFDDGLDSPNAAENFEDGWDGNEGYSFELGSTSTASFDTAGTPEAFEDFEERWDSNESYFLTMPSTATASFDTAGTPEAFEDFEERWRSNESYSMTMGSTTSAVFGAGYTGGGTLDTNTFEDFEAVWVEDLIVVDAATDVITLAGHPFIGADRLTFRIVGDGAMPGGIQPGFPYYVMNLMTDDFEIRISPSASPLDITDEGSGTTYVARDPAAFWIQRIDAGVV